MNRYRSYGELDDQPKTVGDGSFIGVDEYNASENIRPGNVQKAVNHDFTSQDANTRGGFVRLHGLEAPAFGQTWTQYPIDTTSDFFGITYGNSLFVAVGGQAIYTSPDGIIWTSRSCPVRINLLKVYYANNRFVAVGNAISGSTTTIIYSDDGINWIVPATFPTLNKRDIVYGNGKWVAVGPGTTANSGQGSVSTDNGVNWTSGSNQANVFFGFGPNLTYGNGTYLVVNAVTDVVTSTDGLTWTAVYAGPSAYADVVYAQNKFVALTGVGGIYTSTDTTTWTQVRAPDSLLTWRSLSYGNGYFVALRDATTGINILYSTDTATWTSATGPYQPWYDAAFGNGVFVAVSDTGYSMASESTSLTIYASGIYSDPNAVGEQWIMVVAYNRVIFFASGQSSRTVRLGSNSVSEASTIVQANNYVYLFRGADSTPLYWNGDWSTTFAPVPNTTLPASFDSIPSSNQATYYQNRLWVVDGKDSIAASDVLAFTDYDPLANEFNINTGNSDYVVATYPFGQNSLVAFKNKSILLLQNVEGSLSDVTVTEVTRQVGLVGINAVTSIGPDLAYVSNRNINLLTLTATNNSLQHKILPLSARIQKIMDRVNWEVGYKISLGYWNNKLYVALPLDNSTVCNAVAVYNFVTENWYGEWNFASAIGMNIQSWQVSTYLGLQRLFSITDDGRIFVTDEGQNDISGTTVAEISTELITRAYDTDNLNHFQRRIYLDLATNRPRFSAAAFTEGASEESTLLTDQTYSRSETWKFADSAYDLTNANNDYNRAYRKDYSTGPLAAGTTPGQPSTGLQPGTGFEPEMAQEFRLPLLTSRQGRLSWIKVTNTQGFISVMSLGYETRPGQRANLVQI